MSRTLSTRLLTAAVRKSALNQSVSRITFTARSFSDAKSTAAEQPQSNQSDEQKTNQQTDKEKAAADEGWDQPIDDSGEPIPQAKVRRFQFYGTMLVGIVTAGVTYSAICYKYGSFWAFWLQLGLKKLRTEGPNALLDSSLSLDAANLSAPIRMSILSDEAVVERLIEALAPDYVIEVQVKAATFFFAAAQDPVTLPMLTSRAAEIATALYAAAMNPYASKDLASLCLGALRGLASLPGASQVLVDREKIFGVSRAMRSRLPEVTGTASDLMCALVPAIKEKGIKTFRFTADESRSVLNGLANLGTMYSEQGMPLQSITCFELALELDPSNTMVANSLGLEKLKVGSVNDATRLLKRTLKADPSNLDAAFHLHRSIITNLTSKGEQVPDSVWLDAVNALKPALKAVMSTYSSTSTTGQNILEAVPMLSQSYHLLCKSYEQLGRLSEASDCAHEWSLNCPQDAVAHFNAGRLDLMCGHSESALEELDIAARKDPSKPQTQIQRALALRDMRHFAEAHEACEQAKNILESRYVANADDLAATVHRVEAGIYEREGQLEKAAESRLKVVKFRPDNAEERIRAANAALKINQQTTAYQQLTEAISLWHAQSSKYRNKEAFYAAHPRCLPIIQTVTSLCVAAKTADPTVESLCSTLQKWNAKWENVQTQ